MRISPTAIPRIPLTTIRIHCPWFQLGKGSFSKKNRTTKKPIKAVVEVNEIKAAGLTFTPASFRKMTAVAQERAAPRAANSPL